MPSDNGNPSSEEVARRLEALKIANDQSALLELFRAHQQQQQARIPDIFEFFDFPIDPKPTRYWSEGVLDKDEENEDTPPVHFAMIHMCVDRSLVRCFFTAEELDEFIDFCKRVRMAMSPIDTPENPGGLILP